MVGNSGGGSVWTSYMWPDFPRYPKILGILQPQDIVPLSDLENELAINPKRVNQLSGIIPV